MSTKHDIWLHGIGTAVPERSYSQEFALEFMSGLSTYGDSERRFLNRIYRNTGITKRHSVIEDYGKPVEQYEFFARDATLQPEPTLRARNDLFVRHADSLSARAVEALRRDCPFEPADVSHLITVSCTGFSAPGFDFTLVRRFGLPTTVHRFHLGFMGCFAGFTAMKLARTICEADPDAVVLIADVELCTLHFQFKPEQETMVANSLFADGAAAALVSARVPERGGYRLAGFFSRIIMDSEQAMSWTLGDTAFDMTLSAYVPRLLQSDIGEIVRHAIDAVGFAADGVRLWAIHPGGRAILDRIGEALGLDSDDLADSAATLADYGNMSSATIFYVLDRMRRSSIGGPVFAAAFGPGLTVESAALELVRPGG